MFVIKLKAISQDGPGTGRFLGHYYPCHSIIWDVVSRKHAVYMSTLATVTRSRHAWSSKPYTSTMDLKQVQAVQAASTEGLEEGPELWAVEAVASPLVERLKLHFAPGRPTSRPDKPEWLLNTVLQVCMTLYVTRVQGSALSLAVGPLNLESIPEQTKGTRQGARGGWGSLHSVLRTVVSRGHGELQSLRGLHAGRM